MPAGLNCDLESEAAMESADFANSRAVNPEEEDSDPWGAEDDYDEDQDQSRSTRSSSDLQREWEARRLQFHNLGYRDGVTAGNNSSVQDGFNLGFREAVGAGFCWGVARGAASAYAYLPVAAKELLLKDGESGKRLEALHSTVANISSVDALTLYYKDSILWKVAHQGHSSESCQNVSSAESRTEEETAGKRSESEDTANVCCGGGSCEDAKVCISQVLEGGSTGTRHSVVDACCPQSGSTSSSQDDSSGRKPFGEEAREITLRTPAVDTKQLEDNATSYLVSMALGQLSLSDLTSRSSESSSRLEDYYSKVAAELEQSIVRLSSFPRSL